MIELEYKPGHYVTCPVLRRIVLRDGKTVEWLYWNTITELLEYYYEELRYESKT